MNDMSTQRRALSAARLTRAEQLVAIAKGLLTPEDVVDTARRADWVALRSLSLQQLVLSVPEAGPRRWREVRDRLLGVLGAKLSDKDLTVGWLLDPRAGGRRYLAFIDAMRPRREPPWPGFPWEPDPASSLAQRPIAPRSDRPDRTD